MKDVLDHMEGLLDFASQDGYRRLPLLHDVERVIGPWLDRLNLNLSRKDGENEGREGLLRLGELFRDFDGLALEEKRRRVEEAQGILIRFRQGKETSPPAMTVTSALLRLGEPVHYLKGIGPRIGELLARKGVHTIEDLLYFLPRRYEDRRQVTSIAYATPGKRATIQGRVVEARLRQHRFRKTFDAVIEDETGRLCASWFRGNPAYLKFTLKPGQLVIFTGEIRVFNAQKSMVHPDFEALDELDDPSLHVRRIVPIYSETEGLQQKTIRRLTFRVLEMCGSCPASPLPEALRRTRSLNDLASCLRHLHFPPDDADVTALNEGITTCHRRIIYDEFFYFALGMATKKHEAASSGGRIFKTGGPLMEAFYKTLPFCLTKAQERVIGEIHGDMSRKSPMHRLLQGDVGSGKTVVAMAALVAACDNGCQAAFMAPTEILAQQHWRNLRHWAERLSLKTALVTGSLSRGEREALTAAIRSGEIQIVIGTHALIQERIAFKDLGLAVIDEQHRFGVLQRAALREKGNHPHVLVMTATPIPRTLAMTVYGDLDVSVLDEMPPGKRPVRTKVFYEPQRQRVYEIVRGELRKGRQAFVVYPLVEASEGLDLKDAVRMAEHLQQDIFPEFRLGLLHGRLTGAEKERVMGAFQEGNLDLLVATTVIEIGIDIPDASLMVVEHAERFGLTQLHQLRGRVGRGSEPAFCVLLVQYPRSEEAKRRLRVMEETTDGFRIAEEDLAIRGPGEFMGVRQSGIPGFRVGNIVRDGAILAEARTDAFALARTDPGLLKPDHRPLREILLHRWAGRLDLARTG